MIAAGRDPETATLGERDTPGVGFKEACRSTTAVMGARGRGWGVHRVLLPAVGLAFVDQVQMMVVVVMVVVMDSAGGARI